MPLFSPQIQLNSHIINPSIISFNPNFPSHFHPITLPNKPFSRHFPSLQCSKPNKDQIFDETHFTNPQINPTHQNNDQIPSKNPTFIEPTSENLAKDKTLIEQDQILNETHDLKHENNNTHEKNDQNSSKNQKFLEPTSLWEQLIEIIKFSGPATGLWICGPLMSLIDTAVIGQGSSIELAALGPGTVLCDYASYVFMFLSIATSNMVATSLAREDENQVQHQISILLFMGLTAGVMMLLFTNFFGSWALTAFAGANNTHLVPAANTYVQIRALAWPAILVGWVAQSASLGMKDSLGPLKALAIASAINGVGDVVLCTFMGYGIAGAAWATAASQIVAAYTMIDSLNRKGYNGFSISIPSFIELKEIFAIAAPVFITMVSKVAFYSLMIYFATSMGTHKVAAHQVLSQVFSMCSVWGEPLSQTAQSFMPELLYGVNRSLVKARGLLKSLLIIGASVGLVLGTIATSIPWLFPYIFTHDPVIIAEMQKVWIPFFLALCVTPSIHCCEGTLLAGRDLKYISSSMTGCFVFGTLVLMIVRNKGLGLAGCWSALVLFQWARFLLALSRLISPRGVLYSEDLDRFRLAELKSA